MMLQDENAKKKMVEGQTGLRGVVCEGQARWDGVRD
jgi:hypothetical protein